MEDGRGHGALRVMAEGRRADATLLSGQMADGRGQMAEGAFLTDGDPIQFEDRRLVNGAFELERDFADRRAAWIGGDAHG